MSSVNTLLELLHVAPSADTAVILPEAGISVTYGSLREQVLGMADALAAAGIEPGHRVAIVLPNGLPAIVGLSRRIHRRHSRSAQFRIPSGRVQLLSRRYCRESFALPTGRRRRCAQGRRRESSCACSSHGRKRFCAPSRSDRQRPQSAVAEGERHRARPAHQRQHGPAEARAHPPRESGSVSQQHRKNIRAFSRRCVALRDAALPCARPGGLHAVDVSLRRHRGRSGKIQPALVLADGARQPRHLVLRRAHHSSASARARRRRTAGRRRKLRFIRSCSASLPPEMMQRARSGVWRAGARGLRNDGSVAPDVPRILCRPARASRGPSGRAPASESASWMRRAIISRRASAARSSFKAPNVVSGYENNPEANASSFTNGWFRTGDQGFLDADGYLTLTGRIKELINRGGEKIAPREIDEVLLTSSRRGRSSRLRRAARQPGAKKWRPRWCCASRRASPAILAYCREHLADFKRPKKLYIVETIPRTATGKIQRGAVAATLAGAKR